MDFLNIFLNLDRRIIFSLVALLVAVPLIFPLRLPIEPTPEVLGIYDFIEALPAGSHVMIAGDYDPASKPELFPMTEALLSHCFEKDLKVHILTLWPFAPALIQTAVENQANIYGKVAGEDFVFLGYKAGTSAVILGMESSITSVFPTDYDGRPTAPMPIYQDVKSTKDMSYLVDIAAGATVEIWIAYGAERIGVPLGASCTAVSASGYYPYLDAGQITGLAGGMKGSAEYEVLLTRNYGRPMGDATKGMDAQSAVHVFIVLSIIIANICYFISLKREQRKPTS